MNSDIKTDLKVINYIQTELNNTKVITYGDSTSTVNVYLDKYLDKNVIFETAIEYNKK